MRIQARQPTGGPRSEVWNPESARREGARAQFQQRTNTDESDEGWVMRDEKDNPSACHSSLVTDH